MDILDFQPVTDALAALVRGVRDDQLRGPTPCPAYTVADLVDHVDGLALAFTLSARKLPQPGDGAPDPDGSRLGHDWRETIPARLDELAAAWRDPAAYDGVTQAGPIVMPADVAALVALDEVVVHGWDLARATGQDFAPGDAAVLACLEFVASFEVPDGAEDDGLFGPPVQVPADAPPVDRLAGATGRDPAWTP